MPVREKGRRGPGSQPARPFSRPQPHADRRQVRGFSPTPAGFTAETDCLLEESRFEPLVPLATEMSIELAKRDYKCNSDAGGRRHRAGAAVVLALKWD